MADLFLVPYVRAVWRMLGHRLGSSGRMCIFGAGAHTSWLLSVTDDLPRPPIECIVDDHPPGSPSPAWRYATRRMWTPARSTWS